MKTRVLLLGFVLMICTSSASARYYADALGAVRIGLSGMQPTLQGDLSTYYSSDPGFSGFASVDAGLGWVEMAVSYHTVTSSRSTRPDYDNLLLSLAWDVPFSINPCVAIVPGVMVGRSSMSFDRQGALEATTRHDLVSGGRLGMQICLVRPIYLKASAEFLRTYTSDPYDQIRYLVTLGSTFRTPRWLEGVLR
ncbi:hypothetical protein KQI63_13360 [bacterium]|nr:hypothetical protein [bacterium]